MSGRSIEAKQEQSKSGGIVACAKLMKGEKGSDPEETRTSLQRLDSNPSPDLTGLGSEWERQ